MEISEGVNDPPGLQLTEKTAQQLFAGLWSLISAMKLHLGPMLQREHGLEFRDFLALQAIGDGLNFP